MAQRVVFNLSSIWILCQVQQNGCENGNGVTKTWFLQLLLEPTFVFWNKAPMCTLQFYQCSQFHMVRSDSLCTKASPLLVTVWKLEVYILTCHAIKEGTKRQTLRTHCAICSIEVEKVVMRVRCRKYKIDVRMYWNRVTQVLNSNG